ncbi:Ig-like domain repeat protein [Paracidobacterium acidisoli]|nr:Ig-like domain repeat protein [Paracidobacterium acidisoli]MBT9331924.1 Ig-like domain repeat protein [Paracidobacterium acidisoli]
MNFGFPAGVAVLAMAVAAPVWGQTTTRTQLSASTESDNGATKTVLTAHVGDAMGGSLSEGSISFETAKGSVGSAFVQNGVASLALDQLPQGISSVTAVYHPAGSYAASSASASVTPAPASTTPSFSVTGSPTSLSVSPGDFGTTILTITSSNGFSQAVNLSCSSLPAESTCNFNTTPVTPTASGAGQSVTSTLQISTEAPSGAMQDLPGFGKSTSGIAYAILIPGILALAGLGALRRKNFGSFRVLGIVLLLGAGVLGTSGCAARYWYNHRPPSPNSGTPAGTYTVVVAAYSSNGTSVQNATPLNITLTVK